MPTRRVAVTINMPTGYTQTNLDNTAALLLANNVTGIHIPYEWNTLEGPGSGTTSGTFNLTGLTAAIAYFATGKGIRMHLNIDPANLTGRSCPTDLIGVAFDSSTMMTRFHKFWDQVSPLLTANVTYISLGDETDTYFITKPTEWAPYRAFMVDAYAYIKSKNPSVQVGITLTYDGMTSKAKSGCASLHSVGDFVGINYYPEVQNQLTVTSVSAASVAADFANMVTMAAGKPIVIQEIGVQTASISHSSPALQSTFVSSVFSAWNTYSAQIPWLAWFALYDYDPTALSGILVILGGSTPALGAYMGTLGLLAYNASISGSTVTSGAKTAWQTFVTAAAAVT